MLHELGVGPALPLGFGYPHTTQCTKAAARTMWNENSAELSQGLPWTAQQLQALVAHLQEARGLS